MLVKLWRGQYNPLDNDMNPWDIYDEQDEFVLNEETQEAIGTIPEQLFRQSSDFPLSISLYLFVYFL